MDSLLVIKFQLICWHRHWTSKVSFGTVCSILSHVSCGWGHFLGEPEKRDAGAGLVGSLYGGQGGPASPPRKPGAASQQINLGGGGRGCWVRLASPWRSCRPQTLSLAGFHSSSGWQLPPRAPVGPETRGERATTVGVLAAERGHCAAAPPCSRSGKNGSWGERRWKNNHILLLWSGSWILCSF